MKNTIKRKIMAAAAGIAIFAGGSLAGASGIGFADEVSKSVAQELGKHADDLTHKIGQAGANGESWLVTIFEEFKLGEIDRGKIALDAAADKKLEDIRSQAPDEAAVEAEKKEIRKATDKKVAELVAAIEKM